MKYQRTKISPYKIKVMLICSLILTSACEEFVQIDPPKTEIVRETVFSNDASAMASIRGIYSAMMTRQSFTNGQIEKYCGLSSDELVDLSGRADQVEFESNALTAVNQTVLNIFWKEAYSYILNANAILEGLAQSTSMTPAMLSQIEGEAKFIRAFCHFYLTNLFGEIPYIVTTDYRVNAKISRLAVSEINQLLIADLLDAEDLLAEEYSYSSGLRTQPVKAAASAMLARVYLYQGNWTKAEEYATKIIDNTGMFTLVDNLDEIFLANSLETIWQLQPVTPELSTGQAKLFILLVPPRDIVLREELVNAFEENDQRKEQWIGNFQHGDDTYYFPFKYKVYSANEVVEQATVLRLSELYLIRAEARAQQNKLTNAIKDIDRIRNRANLPLIETTNPSITKEELLSTIEHERRIEFFSEWGHRWLDLKRTGKADQVLSGLKSDWQNTDELYPIPNTERLVNPNLTQNPGY